MTPLLLLLLGCAPVPPAQAADGEVPAVPATVAPAALAPVCHIVPFSKQGAVKGLSYNDIMMPVQVWMQSAAAAGYKQFVTVPQGLFMSDGSVIQMTTICAY